MQWSITLGTIGGIAVRLHVTFLLLLVWIGISHFLAGGPVAAATGLLLMLAIFGSVLLHEFGHAFAARRFGVRTPDITLLPIGGVARLERIPDKPREELIVALFGPLVNVAIAALIYIVLTVLGRPDAARPSGFFTGTLLARLLYVNLWLVLFNLIPAFPMDGGRILRAALAHRMGFSRATEIAANVGQAFAFIFALLGFFFNPLLIFIALFVYLGASGEVPVAQLREFARGIPVSSVMLTRFKALRADSPLSEAIDALLSGSDREFPVVDEDGKVQGMLCREDIIRALSGRGVDVPVGQVMQAPVPTARHNEMLESAFHRMNAGGFPSIPVVDHEHNLVGVLSRENVAEVMMIHNALPRQQPQWA